MQVKELVRTPVTTTTLKADIGEARDLMRLKNISALPIVEVDGDDIKLLGIVSYLDLAGVYDDNVKLEQVMTGHVVSVSPGTDVKDAAQMMIDRKVHHLVVMEGDQLRGIVSSFDFVKLVADAAI